MKRKKPRSSNRPDGGRPDSPDKKAIARPVSFSPRLAALLLLALTVIAYLPAWHAGFIWDDDDYVTGNMSLRSVGGLWRIWSDVNATPQYYPLVHSMFWLEYHLWGLHPLGYHLVNVLLHAGAALLLWRVLERLQAPGAWLAAAIFAVHPIEVESVAWITERKNVLSAVCYFAAALAYLHFVELADRRDRRCGWFYGGALVLFVGALLSKTVTASLPAALLLVTWWKTGRLSVKDIVRSAPFFIVGIGLGLLTAWIEKHHVGAQGGEWAFTPGQRLLIAGRAVWFYAGKLFFPANLVFNYPRWTIDTGAWWQWAFPVAATGVAGVLWAVRRRIGRGPLVAVLFFGGTLVPALGFINVFPMRYSFVADHFQYLAGAGLIALAAAGISRVLATRPRSMLPVCAVLLAVLGLLTWRQCRMYSDVETLWRTTIDRNPDAAIAHINLGCMLLGKGLLDEAETHLEKGVQLRPDQADAHYNLGVVLFQKGRFAEAQREYERALEIQPDYGSAQNNLGSSFIRGGRLNEAVMYYQALLERYPNNATLHNNLGYAWQQQGRLADAIGEYRQAVRLQPAMSDADYNLANALLQDGKTDDAILYFEKVIALRPDHADARNNLGYLLLQRGRAADAVPHFRRALAVAPDDPRAHYNLANALIQTGGTREAIDHYERALRLQPDVAEIYNNLAWVLATSPDSSLRDGSKAVILAEKGNELSGGTNPAILCTLGAAYAESGRFPEATSTVQRALSLAAPGGGPWTDILRAQGQLYQERKPYRDGGLTNRPALR